MFELGFVCPGQDMGGDHQWADGCHVWQHGFYGAQDGWARWADQRFLHEYINTFCFCICIYVETCIYRVLFIEWVHLRTGSGIWNSDSKISGDGCLSDSWPDPGYDFYCLFDLPLIFGLPI